VRRHHDDQRPERVVKRLVLVALSGCASYGTMTTARTVAPGRSEVTTSLELDGIGIVETPVRVPLPSLTVDVHRGLRDDLDAGAKISILPLGEALSGLGAEGQLRWRFAGGEDSRFEVAVAPSAGWRSVESSGARWDAAHAVLPVVVGVNLGRRRHQLYLSPKVGWQRWWSAGSMPVDVPFAGTGIGFAWRVRSHVTLLPEISVLRTPTSLDHSEGGAILNVGLGLMIAGH
jgi:hypothetical protein